MPGISSLWFRNSSDITIILSATPHKGHSNSFSALLAMLDPQRFTRGMPVSKQNRDEVMIRRIKEDLRIIQGGFPKRRVEQITLEDGPETPELQLLLARADWRSHARRWYS